MKSPSRVPKQRKSIASKVGQTQQDDYLYRFLESLTEEERYQLVEKIAEIDFDRISSLFSAQETKDAGCQLANTAGAPTNLIPADIRSKNPAEFNRAEQVGWNALREGRVGIVLVAGGEGTRLGFPHPKGQFPIGPVSNKSLFQLLAEQAVTIAARAGRTIPYYVMTSDATHSETISFFESHQYFGLDPASTHFFRQGNMPAVDQKTGRVLLSDKATIAFSPDGHGGLLDAMKKAHIFDDLRERGVDLLFYHQVDNPLTRVCDPAFLGFHVISQADVSTKVVSKEDPAEKVGLLVEANNRHHMIEYTDLRSELAAERDVSGKLRLRCGNIAVHLFRRAFLERMAAEDDKLPYHRSSKSVPYVDDSGELIHPTENNAFKFEKFIFDILPQAERPLAMEVIREQEFVPLKNREGLFSPEHVRQTMRRLHTSWLKQAGWTIADELPIEVPPSVALDAAEFLARGRLNAQPSQ